MNLITYALPDSPNQPRLGILLGEAVINLEEACTWAQGVRGIPREACPSSMYELIYAGDQALAYVKSLAASLEGVDPLHQKGAHRKPVGLPLREVQLFPPLPRPMSLRDFYAFEGHVAAANEIRGRKIPEEWYLFPVFYYTNPNAIFGPGEAVPYPSYTQQMDYELEVACIIGKAGINIPLEKAEEHIFGYTIFNDWSARDVQRAEMKVGLGPAKGKDFASSLGPWLVTPESLADKSTGRPGVYDLRMMARVNGVEKSSGNWKDLHYSFGEMIARASQDTFLYPGDVIGSGTVGTGCLLELTRAEGPWLQPGDVVELEIERLGVLRNRISRMQARPPEQKE